MTSENGLPPSLVPRPSSLALRRADMLSRLSRPCDILVIGGGASGLGTALDAAARGYSTTLVEARDFASGTSSRSTKLIHGGVRYLRQGQIGLVRVALHERARLLRNAPHLVHELRFLIPAYQRWQLPYYGAGLTLYDLLAGRLGLARTRIVGSSGALRHIPTLRRSGLRGGVLYSDAQFDDARLAIALARTAAEHGATLLNYACARELVKERGRVAGALVVDAESGQEHIVRARVVVNATGVLSDAIRRLDDPGARPLVAASQGVHLVLDREFLPSETALLVPRTDDGRVVFIIPWKSHTLAGTTDTLIADPTEDSVATHDEIEFILRHVAAYLTRQPARSDILSVFAGLRPLVRSSAGASTSRLGRDHHVFDSPSGLVTVVGGKWTTYRRMAQDTVDRATRVAGLAVAPCRTANLPLAGTAPSDIRWREFGATDTEIRAYEARFSGELHARLPYSLAMLAYVIDHEMPVTLEDVLSRRLRALPVDARAAAEAAPVAAAVMATLQRRNAVWRDEQVTEFRQKASTICLPPEQYRSDDVVLSNHRSDRFQESRLKDRFMR